VTEVSFFEKYRPQAYPYNFTVEAVVGRIAGGIPSDPKVAEGWLKTKVADRDDLIREEVARIMVERAISLEEATQVVDSLKHLNGFKRSEKGPYIEGRQMKACIKESANIRWAGERWGPTRKGTVAFFAEHVFVNQDVIHLGVDEPSGIEQQFVHTFRGSSLQQVEYVNDAKITFDICTDYPFKTEQWALLWLTAEQQGIGACRSQGFGRFTVTNWKEKDLNGS
jgi:hypothetical protein